MPYGPEIPGAVLEVRRQRLQGESGPLATPQPAAPPAEESDSSDDDFGPVLPQSNTGGETEALKRLQERSLHKTWENMDPKKNPNRAGWMHDAPAELAGTFSTQKSAEDRAKEMMGLKK